MKVHGNAKLHPNGRLLMCQRVIEQGWSLTEAAEAAGVSERTCSKWLARYRSEGQPGYWIAAPLPSRFPTARPSGSSRRSAPCGACG